VPVSAYLCHGGAAARGAPAVQGRAAGAEASLEAHPAGVHADIQARLAALSERVRGVEIRDFETQSSEALASGLAPQCAGLLQEAAATLQDVVDRLDPGHAESDGSGPGAVPGESDAFERTLDDAVDTRRLPGDVAFIAALELRQRRDRLTHLGRDQPPLAFIGECDSAMRAIRKALGALDAVIAEAAGTAPRLDFSSVLQSSLRVRRRYATFRARILASGEPRAEGLRQQLRALGTHIAKLVGWDVYPELRVHDRLQLRDLQARILGWLQAGEASATADGVRLWEDLVAFVRMTGQINQREELVEHDRGVVEHAWRALARVEDGGVVPEPILRLLASLEGLDEETDGLLQAGDRRVGPWRGALGPARERLGLAAPAPGGERG